MTLTIELNKKDEELLAAAAQKNGVDASTLAQKLLVDILPSLADDTRNALITVKAPRHSPSEMPVRKPRKAGSAIGIITLADDFDAPLDDFKDYM